MYEISERILVSFWVFSSLFLFGESFFLLLLNNFTRWNMSKSMYEHLIIRRKTMIKEINGMRAQRKVLEKRIMEAPEGKKADYKVDLRILNARLSEKWGHYNDLAKTMALMERVGHTGK